MNSDLSEPPCCNEPKRAAQICSAGEEMVWEGSRFPQMLPEQLELPDEASAPGLGLCPSPADGNVSCLGFAGGAARAPAALVRTGRWSGCFDALNFTELCCFLSAGWSQ